MATPPTCHPDRKHFAKGQCKPCYMRVYSRDYLTNNRNRRKADCHPERGHFGRGLCRACFTLQHQQNNRAWWRRANRRAYLKRNGVQVVDYEAMVAEQEGRCFVCGDVPKRSLHMDHDHREKTARRPICARCNNVLGLVVDDDRLLEQLAQYIRRFARRTGAA